MAADAVRLDDASLRISRLLEPEVRRDPYPFYHHLREAAPVHWDEAAAGGGGAWVLTRHADVMAMLRDPRMTATRMGPPPGEEWLPEEYRAAARQVFRAMPHQLLFLDPPDHTRLRGLVNKAFTPRLVEGMRPRIRERVNALLDALYERGRMEVIAELAYPLPAIVIAELLGVPPEDRAQFIKWSSDFGAFLDGSSLTPQEAMQALVGIADFMDYFRAIIAKRQDEPRDDLLQALLAAREREDVLSEDELLANLVLLLAAGHGTTTHLIENVVGTGWVNQKTLAATATGFAFCTYGNEIFAVDKANPPQMSSSSAFADVAGSPPKASCCATSKNFVILGDTNDGVDDLGDRVWWSALGDPTDWSPSAATQAGNLRITDTPGPIKALVNMRDGVAVYKDDALYMLEYQKIGRAHV